MSGRAGGDTAHAARGYRFARPSQRYVARVRQTVPITPDLYAYVVGHTGQPDAVQRDLIERTYELGDVAGMQISPDQGAFLTVLTKLVGARRAIEVGTFTGYSALCIAYGLPPDGRLLCCDVNEEWTSIARDAWQCADVSERIELRLGDALDTLRSLPMDESLDLAFVDANKDGYWAYYEELLPRLRPGGTVLFDNTLFGGLVADFSTTDTGALAIREFNERLAADDRVEIAMLTVADGLTLARKRG